jgi:hypothetical protein
MTRDSLPHWKHLLTYKIAIVSPILYSLSVGALGGLALGSSQSGISIAFWSTVILKIHWMYEMSRLRPGSSKAAAVPMRSYTSIATQLAREFTGQPSESEYQSSMPSELWFKGRDARQLQVKIPDWMSVEHFMAIDIFIRAGLAPTESALIGHEGPFTGKPTGTLAQFREYCFEKKWGAANKLGAWKDVYKSGWSFTREGGQVLRMIRWHPEVVHLVPSPTPGWYKRLQKRYPVRK